MGGHVPLRPFYELSPGSNPGPCPKCYASLRRLHRKGFLQKWIISFFGFFPWECPVCRKAIYFKHRSKHKSPPVPNA
jgi:hypothetical protein